jgi:hypothetical protein
MLNLHSARIAFLVVTLISVGAALFRTYAGPERARERRNMAQMACIKSGGEWLVIERSEVCRKSDTPLLLSW